MSREAKSKKRPSKSPFTRAQRDAIHKAILKELTDDARVEPFIELFTSRVHAVISRIVDETVAARLKKAEPATKPTAVTFLQAGSRFIACDRTWEVRAGGWAKDLSQP